MTDLFEQNLDHLPELQKVLKKHYKTFDNTYEHCRKFQKDVEAVGYTFDWYLDAQPYNLRKI